MDYTTFHKFPELPLDIRAIIWDIAISDLPPRIVPVRERNTFEYQGQFSRVRNDWAVDTPPPIIEPVTFPIRKKMLITTKQEESELFECLRRWGTVGAWMEGKGSYPRQWEGKVGISSAYDSEDGIEFLDKEGRGMDMVQGFEYGEFVWKYPALSPRPEVEYPPGYARSEERPDPYNPNYCYSMRSLGGKWVIVEFQYFPKGPREPLKGFPRTCAIPSLLLVSRESFALASQSYERILPRWHTPATSYFNFKKDILYLNKESPFYLFPNDEDIWRLAIGRHHNNDFDMLSLITAVLMPLKLLRNVKELMFVTELDTLTGIFKGEEELDFILTSPDLLTDERKLRLAEVHGEFPNVKEKVEAALNISNRVSGPGKGAPKWIDGPEVMGHFLALRRDDLAGLLADDLGRHR